MADIKNHSTLATSLVSYWDLQEASGTRYDLHGSNNLTDINTVLSGTGKIGTCADFEASNSEYLQIADNASLSITGDLSFSTWIRLESFPASAANFSLCGIYQESNNNSWIFSLFNDAGTYKWRINLQNAANATSQGFITASSLSLSTWYHVVFVYTASAGTVQVYLNGVSEGTATSMVTNIKDSTASFELGTNIPSLGGAYVDGFMDEVGLWSKALTGSEVTDLYNGGSALPYYDPVDIKDDATLATSLVSYWKFDETSGNRADAHGTNTLTDNNTVLSATGILNNGADFENANNEYLSITNASQTGLNVTGDLSVSFWVNMESAPAANTSNFIFGKWVGSGGQYFSIYRDVAGVKKLRLNLYDNGDGASNVPIDIDYTISLSTWTNIVIVADVGASNTITTIYINGVLLGSATHTGVNQLFTSTGSFLIGGGQDGTLSDDGWDGLIDEFGFWSKTLTVAEARALYGYGTPPEYDVSSASGPANLKSYNTNLKANIKSINTNPIANIKSLNTNV